MLAGTAPTERSAAVGPRRSPPAAQPPAGAGCAVLKGQLRGARRAAGAARGGSAGSSRRDHFRVSAAASAPRDHAEAGGCGAERGRPPPPSPPLRHQLLRHGDGSGTPCPAPGGGREAGGVRVCEVGETPPGSLGGLGGVRAFFFSLLFFSPPLPPRRSHVAAGDWSPPGPGRGWVCMRRAPSSPPLPSRPPAHSLYRGSVCTAVLALGIAAALPIRQGLSNHLPLPPSPLLSLYFIFTCSLLTRLFLNPAWIYFVLSLFHNLLFYPFSAGGGWRGGARRLHLPKGSIPAANPAPPQPSIHFYGHRHPIPVAEGAEKWEAESERGRDPRGENGREKEELE